MIARLFRPIARTVVILAGVLTALWSWPDDSRAAAAAESRAPAWADFVRCWAFRAIVLGAVAAVIGLLVVVSGIVPLKSSSGHWAITEAFLQFAKRRSLATHSLAIDVPRLDEPRLAMMGAGHYDFGCRPCHGSPALAQPVIAARMLPQPPDLQERAASLDPAELFYVVKHGLKFTGMPAWPALDRDDEVWAMVAFLQRLPDLTAREYEELAGTIRDPEPRVPIEGLVVPASPPEAVTDNCSRCHGLDGLGRGAGAFPRLAGQRATYLHATLRAYARGERHSGIMQPVAAGLDPGVMERIAQYYASRPVRALPTKPHAASEIEHGRAIATRGLPDRLVPACVECHGPGTRRRNPHYPVLAGQYADYIVQQLSLFRARRRGGTAYHRIMHKVAGQLTDDQVRAVAAYYSSLEQKTDGAAEP